MSQARGVKHPGHKPVHGGYGFRLQVLPQLADGYGVQAGQEANEGLRGRGGMDPDQIQMRSKARTYV